MGFFEAVAVAIDGKDLGAMHQSIDQGDDAGGVWEDLVPFAKALVRGQDRGPLLIAARDDFEQQIGIAGIVGQVPDLIDAQERHIGVTT